MPNLTHDRNSCLSDGVHQLICGLNEEYKRTYEIEEIHTDLLKGYDMEDLSVLKNKDGSIDFVNTVRSILPICYSIHKQLMQLTAEQFDGKFGMDLEWTACRERTVECFEMLKNESDFVDTYLSFLLLFSILEHSLGDIYLSTNGSKQCPTNLKELLMTKEIQQLIGENVALMMYVLAGSPQGVNLRNVLWHGFASLNEIPPQYGSFLLFVMTSISSKLSGVYIKRRPLVTLSKLDDLCVFPLIESSDIIQATSHVFNKSLFISPRMLPVWEKALFYYEEQRYGFTLILLIPQLEHSLRKVFAWVNGCPDRVLTAESTTLYTTFDEILAPSLPDGSENQLRNKIGDKYLEMLLDVLVHPDGQRIRDHISHGEVHLDLISQGLCSHVICICIAFAVYFSDVSSSSSCINTDTTSSSIDEASDLYANSVICQANMESYSLLESATVNDDGIDLPLDDHSIIQQIIRIANNYHSVYHPIEILKREICSASEQVEDWNCICVPDDLEGEIEAASMESKEIIQNTMSGLCSKNAGLFPAAMPDMVALCTDEQFTKGINMLCAEIHLPTLFRPRREFEVVSLLHRIVQHCCTMTTQVIDSASQRYHQWMRKELRSRQRTNYKRLVNCLPFYQGVLKLTLVLVVVELASLHESTQPSYIKFLKRCLQFTENLESLSSPSKNRWDECKAVGNQLLELIDKHSILITRTKSKQ